MQKHINKVPKHLGIILDGNRRWARENGLPIFEGHRKGVDNIKNILEWCLKRKIKNLTLYVFSTENWNRSRREINYLMNLTNKSKKIKPQELAKYGVRVKVIGQTERAPGFIRELIRKFEDLTEKNKKINLNLAFSYGGRNEIVRAVKKIIKDGVTSEKVTEDLISKNLLGPDLDMIIRTGKEKRISNFLIWQAAYAELYFLDKHWPDFSEKDLDEALNEYSKRQRRFGR